MSSTAKATLTDFLRDPKAVIDRLESVDVVLHRRNAEDLRLSLESRSEIVADSVRLVARMLGAALSDTTVRGRMEVNIEAIPWVSFLPMPDRQEFLAEFLRTAEAAAELGVMTPLAQLLREWQETAMVYADPELAAELKRPLFGDGDRVARPTD